MKLPKFVTKRRQAARTPMRPSPRSQIVYLIAIGGVALAFGYATFVTYQLVQRTLTASEVVIRLRPEVAPEPFRAEDVRQATAHSEAKRNVSEPSDWAQLSNPFQEGRGAAVPPATP